MLMTQNAGADVEQPELPYTACGNLNGKIRPKKIKYTSSL